MKEALLAAQEAFFSGEVPVGAVAVHNGEILARSGNLRETRQDPTAHAEILVLQEAAKKLGRWHLEGVTVYVTLEPCPMCAGAMVQARVERLVFGAPDSRMGAAGSTLNVVDHPAFSHRLEVVGGIMEEEGRVLLQKFFQERRKEKKIPD
ncbi:MAG: tRNA adenosine(34) deaminase TadA [Firmicutes bacterium]|nr:tRNA adenosine(34) deaminase TadA [Bacillota bacterium]MCL5039502.1 tRNA adenosine(34) deaminase TadA [Bacillota bacterium]